MEWIEWFVDAILGLLHLAADVGDDLHYRNDRGRLRLPSTRYVIR
jgi:hypothetical protein